MTKHLKESKMGYWEHWYHDNKLSGALFVHVGYLMYLPHMK